MLIARKLTWQGTWQGTWREYSHKVWCRRFFLTKYKGRPMQYCYYPCQAKPYRRIFVYDIFLFSIRSEYWKAKAWLTVPRNWSLMNWILFGRRGLKILQRMYELIRALPPRNFEVFSKTISSWILCTPKVPNISPNTKFHKLFIEIFEVNFLLAWCLLCT